MSNKIFSNDEKVILMALLRRKTQILNSGIKAAITRGDSNTLLDLSHQLDVVKHLKLKIPELSEGEMY